MSPLMADETVEIFGQFRDTVRDHLEALAFRVQTLVHDGPHADIDGVRQQLLRFGQRQTQVGEIAKTIRPADLHNVETSGLTINPS